MIIIREQFYYLLLIEKRFFSRFYCGYVKNKIKYRYELVHEIYFAFCFRVKISFKLAMMYKY